MSGLLSTLNTANLGLQAQQAALNVTSHNVANANTAGYTRERADLAAISSANVSKDNSTTIQIGTGVTVTDISRIRDVLKDYQVRSATTSNATYQTTSDYLTQIQSIMNEPSDTGLSSLIGKFYSDWSSLASDSTTGSSARTTLVQDTKTLTDALNNTYTQLQSLKTDTQTAIQAQVASVNTKLNEVDNVNQKVMDIKSSGSEPNDLLDQRDLLVDQLSESFNVSTAGGSLDGITLSTSTTGTSATANFISPTDTSSESRLAYISDIEPSVPPVAGSYDLTYYKNGNTSVPADKVTLTVTGATDSQIANLSESRVLVTGKDGTITGTTGATTGADGSTKASFAITSTNELTTLGSSDGVFAGLTTTEQSVDKYTDDLNSMAKSIALTVNTIESGTTVATGDSNPYFVNSNDATYTKDSSGNSVLDTAYSTNIDTNEAAITAGNISINTEILDDPSKVVTEKDSTSAAGDGTRALAISQLGSLKLDIQDMTSSATRTFFAATDASLKADTNGIPTLTSSTNGLTVSGYYTNKITAMGTDASEAASQLATQSSVLNSLTQARTSESGVSTDDEMTNLIQYNHAYAANAKVITTVSDLLDVVIALIR